MQGFTGILIALCGASNTDKKILKKVLTTNKNNVNIQSQTTNTTLNQILGGNNHDKRKIKKRIPFKK